jgi:hypothetical protein
MEHVVHHGLSQEQATLLVQRALEAYAPRFAKGAPELKWSGLHHLDFSFTAKGKRMAGALDIEAEKFRVQFDVPFLLRPFVGRATKYIESELAPWIAKAKAGEL